MKWNDVGGQVCSVARAVSVLGDRWTLLFLREAFSGTTRFEDFLDGVGASRATVAERLDRLTRDGIFEQHEYQTNPVRYEYRLSEKGAALLPVVLTLQSWGDRWLGDGRGRPATLVCGSCGRETDPILVCDSCGEAVGDDLRAEYREDAWVRTRQSRR